MVTAKTRPWPTYQDYLNIPGDDRYELINGEFILVSAPNTGHQTVEIRLGSRMYFFASLWKKTTAWDEYLPPPSRSYSPTPKA